MYRDQSGEFGFGCRLLHWLAIFLLILNIYYCFKPEGVPQDYSISMLLDLNSSKNETLLRNIMHGCLLYYVHNHKFLFTRGDLFMSNFSVHHFTHE